MKTISLALTLTVLAFAPAYAQDTKAKTDKLPGRNDVLKKTFHELASKGSAHVVKVGPGAFGVILDGKLIATTSAAAKGGRIAVKGPKGSGEARVIGVDEKSGVALLECPFDAKGIDLANTADLRIGQYVITVGTEDEVVCAGVLSAKNRKVEPRDLSQANILMGLLSDGIDGPKRAYPKVLQHDAPMSDEILGTALVDSSGKLVGMNVGTGYRGSSYAIAAADLMACIEGIKSGKPPAEKADEKPAPAKGDKPSIKIGKPWLGASVKEQEDGTLVVNDVAAQGPADQAGIQVGDRIYAVDGAKVTTLDEISEKISAKKPGDSVVISLLRDGEKQKVTVKLGEK
ncbi:MAG: S1C family serine protease [Planctomycetota bacterium]